MSAEGSEGREERRRIYVPFALAVEPVGESVRPENISQLDSKLKEEILRLYREVKVGGNPGVRRTDSGKGSYRYAGYLFSEPTAASYDAILEQLQPAFFLANIIDDAIDELFPKGTSARSIEVAPPTSDEELARHQIQHLRRQVERESASVLRGLPSQYGSALARAPSALALLASITLLGGFALAHAWIQYRGANPVLEGRVGDLEEQNAMLLRQISQIEQKQASAERPVPVIVRVDRPAPVTVDPSAPRVITINSSRN